MDWSKQTQETVKAWTETQQKMWDNWMEMVSGGAVSTQAAEVWRKTMETWQEAVANTLEAQTEWTRTWTEALTKTPNVPKEMVEWVEQVKEMNKRWTEAQQQLWQSWFEMAKKIEPAQMDSGWDKEGKKVFQAWQDSTQKLMEAQLKWANMWGEKQAGTETANAKK